VALSDVQLRGQRIAAGDTVVLALLAANRDEAVFDRPDEFLVDRPNANRQVGFTVGPYSCMGQALARLEGQVFFTTLLSRFPRMVPGRPAAGLDGVPAARARAAHPVGAARRRR
jgi:cytochrome P450